MSDSSGGTLEERARELAVLIEKEVGHCCGDMLNLPADELYGVLVAFGREIAEEAAKIADAQGEKAKPRNDYARWSCAGEIAAAIRAYAEQDK